ncbi:hypothetical protein [Streptomyces parvulus]|uniref:hypothetical protein n=1 Tax=Streptomyces parvulus TaxID=146923 RepID=UPI0037152152
MSAPLVINLKDGSVWERRAMSQAGVALYALAGTCACPEYVMASEAELAELGIVGSADALPMPVGPSVPVSEAELDSGMDELSAYFRVRLALASAQRGRRDLRARVAELEAAQGTVYRAEHPDSGITLGHYSTAKAARDHCEAVERRAWSTFECDWIEDEEDGVSELVVMTADGEEPTGYIVTALELDSEYDAEADE